MPPLHGPPVHPVPPRSTEEPCSRAPLLLRAAAPLRPCAAGRRAPNAPFQAEQRVTKCAFVFFSDRAARPKQTRSLADAASLAPLTTRPSFFVFPVRFSATVTGSGHQRSQPARQQAGRQEGVASDRRPPWRSLLGRDRDRSPWRRPPPLCRRSPPCRLQRCLLHLFDKLVHLLHCPAVLIALQDVWVGGWVGWAGGGGGRRARVSQQASAWREGGLGGHRQGPGRDVSTEPTDSRTAAECAASAHTYLPEDAAAAGAHPKVWVLRQGGGEGGNRGWQSTGVGWHVDAAVLGQAGRQHLRKRRRNTAVAPLPSTHATPPLPHLRQYARRHIVPRRQQLRRHWVRNEFAVAPRAPGEGKSI